MVSNIKSDINTDIDININMATGDPVAIFFGAPSIARSARSGCCSDTRGGGQMTWW